MPLGAPWKSVRAVALALTALAAIHVPLAAAGDAEQSSRQVDRARVATSGNHSELIEKLPITARRGAKPRVVMSLGPERLRRLRSGDRLKASAEVQVTVNCDNPTPRCVGPIYDYNPIGHAQLVLTDGKGATSGVPLSGSKRFVCRQKLPDREHHCVIVVGGSLDIGNLSALPCPSERCFVNLVLDAHHPRASRGEVLLIGGNKPDGSIPQDRGRVNAVLLRPGNGDFPAPRVTRQRTIRSMKLDNERRVIYSQRFDQLRAGDGLEVQADAFTDRSRLPYSTITATQVILAEGPRKTHSGALAKGAVRGGEITETNGFNCTRRKAVCISRKVGVAEVARDARRPLYVNVVMLVGPKRVSARSGDRQRVLRRGGLSVTRYRAPQSPNRPR